MCSPLNLEFNYLENTKSLFKADNGMQFEIKYGNDIKFNQNGDKQDFVVNNKTQSGIFLVDSPNDKDNLSKEIVLDFSEPKEPINLGDRVKCSENEYLSTVYSDRGLHFNIKLKQRYLQKRTRLRTKNSNKKNVNRPMSDLNSNAESDLENIISIVKNKVSMNKKVGNPVKKIMIDKITGQYHILSDNSEKKMKKDFLEYNSDKIKCPAFCQETAESQSNFFLLTKNVHSRPISNLDTTSMANKGSPKVLSYPKIKYINSTNAAGTVLNSSINANSDNLECPININNKNLNNEKIIYWQEGNINLVSDPICLSTSLIEKYSTKFLHDNYINNSKKVFNHYDLVKPESKISDYSTVKLSWETVKERIEELEEEAMTKFILHYKSPTFKEHPKAFKKIHFDMNTVRKKDSVVIPFNGMPFIFLGICIYSCHLGHAAKNSEVESGKVQNSKKVGCPATISIAKIARFPDFDISPLSLEAERNALIELRDAWDYQSQRVRFYIEYLIKEPKSTDHHFHEIQKLVNNNKFQEPVDPRILNHIRELTKVGITSTRKIERLIADFIKDKIFKGEKVPSDRRRYNPSIRDIQYAIRKAKDEANKEGKNLTREHCHFLTNEISSIVKDINNEQLLVRISEKLNQISEFIKKKQLDISSNPSSLQEGNVSSLLDQTPPKSKKIKIIPTSEPVHNEIIYDSIFELENKDFLFLTENNFSIADNGQYYMNNINTGLTHQVELFPTESNYDNLTLYNP